VGWGVGGAVGLGVGPPVGVLVGLRVGSFVGLRVGYLVGPEVGRRDGDGVTPVPAGAKLQVFIPPLICGSSLMSKFDVGKPSLIGQHA